MKMNLVTCHCRNTRCAQCGKMSNAETVARIPGHFSLHVLHVKCGGFGGALRLGLLATCPVPIVHGSGLACVPGRPAFASCDSVGCPAPPHSKLRAATRNPETSGPFPKWARKASLTSHRAA